MSRRPDDSAGRKARRFAASATAAATAAYQRRALLWAPSRRAKALALLREKGLVALLRRLANRGTYAHWVRDHDTLTSDECRRITSLVATWSDPPLISIVMPTYQTKGKHLREAIDSVVGQLYPHWELLIVDDGSPSGEPPRIADEYAEREPRVRPLRLPVNVGISAAANAGIAAAKGAVLAFVDHDDLLPSHALFLVADELRRHPTAALVYTDSDHVDEEGNRYDPYFKPDLNLDLLLCQNYVNHLTAVSAEVARAVGPLDSALDGAQDHDFVLRVLEQVGSAGFRHIPHVGYHWRVYRQGNNYSASQADIAAARSREAVAKHLARCGLTGDVVTAPAEPRWNRVRWPVPSPPPPVTAIIPTRDRLDLLRTTVEGLLHGTDYPELRVLIADNDSSDPATLDYLARLDGTSKVTVLRTPGPFNYSAINNEAMRHVETPYALLLNNDIAVREPRWLAEMVGSLSRSGVGVVGAKLYFADGRVQHAGIILGIGGVGNHSHKGAPGAWLGYYGRLVLAQDMSAVTGACLLTRRELWNQVGGLDAEHLAVAFSDVDYCLRVREAGQRVVWTPYAELDHLESASRGYEDTPERQERFWREVNVMLERWGDRLTSDPAYNPNLTLDHLDFSRTNRPRAGRPCP